MTVDEMCDALRTGGFDRVEMYPTMGGDGEAFGDWFVKVVKDGREKRFRDRSLVTVLGQAVAVEFLPLVPRKPVVEGFEVVEDGLKWNVVAGPSRHLLRRFVRKSDASEWGQAWRDRMLTKSAEWQRDWAEIVASGIEGVDWEWDRV